MKRIKNYTPLVFNPGCRASKVSVFQRIINSIFGAPNARRANGIISAGFDVTSPFRNIAYKLFGKNESVPVFEIDRRGIKISESLPRIWLSERVCNTKNDNGRRIFVESYPSSPDRGGVRALELGDRYLGEGMNRSGRLTPEECEECFKAAEVLYLHAVRRGNRKAASRLAIIYSSDLCNGNYYVTYLEEVAKHSKRRDRHMRSRLIKSA